MCLDVIKPPAPRDVFVEFTNDLLHLLLMIHLAGGGLTTIQAEVLTLLLDCPRTIETVNEICKLEQCSGHT